MSKLETRISEIDLVERLKWRYATKKFDDKRKIDKETWEKIEDALLLTPSSFGLQPWTFVVVTDQKVKAQLPEHSWGQKQPVECSHLVVFARPQIINSQYVDNYVKRIADVRGVSLESLASYHKMMSDFVVNTTEEKAADWMSRQCYIALGNLMTVAAMFGLDSCPMEGFAPEHYDRILGLEERELTSVVLCPLGYRAEDDKYASTPKVRFEKEKVFLNI